MKFKGKKNSRLKAVWQFMLFISLWLSTSLAQAATPAGYSTFYIPGDEEQLLIFHNYVNNTAFTETHTVITAVAWAPNTVVYYDHWENGYDFDPENPEKTDVACTGPGGHCYDEKITLANRGSIQTFESTNIPANPRNPANLFYDGKDKMYAVGGEITVNRVTWPSAAGTVESIGMEVYPVRPQLTTYIMPVGENLAYDVPQPNPDFERVFALVQATENGTIVQFDIDRNGTLGDTFCSGSRVYPCPAGNQVTSITMNAGECFLLDRWASSPTTGDPAPATEASRLLSGSTIKGSETLQVHYLFMNRLTNYNSRGVSAFPTGFWDNSYYAPVPTDAGAGNPTDLYLTNPHSSVLTINYANTAGSGSFTIPANSTRSYFEATATYLAQASATYLNADDVFWGISSIDRGSSTYDWSYSLIPTKLLVNEYFVGWAPGAYPPQALYPDDSGIYITSVQDTVRVYVDRNNDGTAENFYDIPRLGTQYIFDAADYDMSRAHIWATGPIALVYGENPDLATTGNPAIDTGDAMIPGQDFVDLVLGVEKTTNPVIVSTTAGSTTQFSIYVRSSKYTIDGISVIDTLDPGWEYVGPTSITLADKTTRTDAPALSGTGNRTLTWSSSILGNMAENQEIIITFTARTTAASTFAVGDMTRNYVEAIGTRTVGNPPVTQTFTTSDFAFNAFQAVSSQMAIDKTSGAADPLNPGQTFTYTVRVPNTGSTALTNVSIYDELPAGLTYVAGSSLVWTEQANNVRDVFGTQAYNLNAGTVTWSADWTETDTVGGAATGGLVSVAGGVLQFAPVNASVNKNVRDEFGTVAYSNNNGSENWSNSWTETDIPQYTGLASDGVVLVAGSTLRLAYQGVSRVRDEFTTSSYTRDDGSLDWTNDWDETGDNDLPGSGNIDVDVSNADVVTFRQGAAGRSIQRTAPVTGTDVTISFAMADSGIDANEGVIAEFSLNGGTDWTEMQRLTNGTLSGTNPYTTSTAGATSIIIRFRTFGTWANADDEATVDTVNILYTNVGSQIVRTANLSGATSASLTFDFARNALEAGDTMVVEVNGGSGWTTLATYNSGTAQNTKTFDLASYISSATQIRFRATGGVNDTNEYFSLDNVNIAFAVNELVSANGAAISRTASLATANSAILSFDFSRANLEAGDTMDVQVNGTTIASFDSTTATGAKTYNITSYALTPTTVRFVVTGGVTEANEYFTIDNVDISYAIPGASVAAHNPPGFVTSADARTLNARQTLVLTFNVTVKNPLATDIESITNEACANATQSMVPVCDDVTNYVSKPSTATAQVGDLVWFDMDRDGLKDVTENGLANVEVTLKDQYGTPVAVTTTDSNGLYLFTGIEPGNGYYIEVTDGRPAGLIQSAPAGRSDDRTGSFNLAAGQVYLDADIGYKPSLTSGTIGDYVWHDFDNDSVQEAGEPGLAGVRVQLYLDDGDGVFEPGTGDTWVDNETTDASGHYLFTGVTASGTQDYFVYVNATQTILSGYTPTTASATKILDMAAGTVSMTNDFGLRKASTFTYRDRVWFDADKDMDDDGGETGIVGVTVELLDASLNVIATVITAADGTFQFVGLDNSTFYTVRVTDRDGKLADYYGTTPEAATGEFEIIRPTANVDYTAEPLEPHFGYNVKGAIGDTVFNDLDGDGTQDAGEPGISGVTVALYTDANGNGWIDGADAQVATRTTDANGTYLFSGRTDGNYIVSIPTAPTGYTYTGTDSDPVTAGAQQAATISGGNSILTKDFGYRAAANRSVTGIIWEDTDADGIIDNGTETRLQSVTVQLWRDDGDNVFEPGTGDTLISATSTDASGVYLFSGLPSAVYWVRVTDQNGIVNGFTTTYEYSEGTTAPFNSYERVDLSSGNQSGRHFGYRNPVPTRAVIGGFESFNDGGSVVLRWQTLSEQGTIGFYLYRLSKQTGRYVPVNDRLLPGLLHAPAGGWYSYPDAGAAVGVEYTYCLEEVEVGGRRISYGPWTVSADRPLPAEKSGAQLEANASAAGFKRIAKPLPERTRQRMQARLEARQETRDVQLKARSVQAKISVTEDGLHFISADDIAQVLGRSTAEAADLISTNKIRLRNKGKTVAALPSQDGQGLYFYGEKIETRYTDENVYWLDIASGMTMQTVNRAPQQPAADGQYFQQVARFEENNYPLDMMFYDPHDDFWMWDYLFPGYGRDDASVSVATPGVVDNDTATLTVALQGASEAYVGNDHRAVISVNGVQVGDVQWDGTTASVVSLPVDTQLLIDGENSIEIAGKQLPGVPYDLFYLNYITIAYPRYFTADDNQLAAESSGYATVVIDGFTDADIRVFDITNPLQPKVITGAEIKASDDNASHYQVGFQADSPAVQDLAGNPAGRYLAVTPGAIKSCTPVADQPSSLMKQSTAVNYFIITTSGMLAAAQELADYRADRGYKTLVVDIEDIYDEFNYGIRSADAIQAFLKNACGTGRIRPKYVLLAGEGSFDYKNRLGYGDSVIPPLMAATPDGLIATDNIYADIVGSDGLPDLAIGRIPVINAQEFSAYTAKVIGYEAATGPWASKALLAAAAPDAGGNFPGSSDEVADLFPASYTLDKIYLNILPLTEARTNFVAGINEGRSYVNFIGHGGLDRIGNADFDKYLFSIDNMTLLHNGDLLPVVSAMTCLVGNYGYPGLDSLSEAMVLKENGGAVAMWSPAGYGYNDYSVQLGKDFYGVVFPSGQKVSGKKVLGDAVRSALKTYAAAGENLYYLNLYNLMGDPALAIK